MILSISDGTRRSQVVAAVACAARLCVCDEGAPRIAPRERRKGIKKINIFVAQGTALLCAKRASHFAG
jgi:hypothetical protein